MWPFKRSPQPAPEDAVSIICHMLVERWWEWTPGESEDDHAVIRHTSGVCLSYYWSSVYSYARVSFALSDDGILSELPPPAANRIYRAIQDNAAARIAHKPFRYTDAAIALADAIKAGAPVESVFGLIDEILEYHQRTESL